jgi:DNA repair protein RadC
MPSRPLQSAPPDRFADLAPHELTPAEADSLIRLALAALAERHRPGVALSSPEDTRAYLRLMLGDRRNEVFGCVFVDNRNRVRAVEELFQGTIDGAAVYPRVVVQRALETNSAAVVLFHCHPSGVAEPSSADEALTRRLQDALMLVDVRVLDHVVVTTQGSVSFAERGLL